MKEFPDFRFSNHMLDKVNEKQTTQAEKHRSDHRYSQ